ncbi:MAG: GFA family protein [Amphiplicatus sp.]
MTDSIRSGGCRCGAVRFEAKGAPKFVGNCHCEDCRRSTGAPFSTYVGYRDDAVRWKGASRTLYESSPGVRRGFCATCGAPLSYQGPKWAGETHLFLGDFDDPSGLVPTGDVFTTEALPWVALKKANRE